jgi:hypothetical protein
MKNLIQLIRQNFDIEITKIEILIDHTYSKVYLLESVKAKYVLKEMGANNKLENESELNKHLMSKGIKVPKIYHTTTGNHIIYNNELMYILYEFIEGKMYDLNTAPDWYLVKQIQTLGKIQNALKDYKQLPLLFGPGQDFFIKEKYKRNKQSILEKISQAEKQNDIILITALNERLKHIKRVSCFEIDCDKLTYVNSHGDFYMNQIIVRNNELVTIDWTHPHYLPACNEVMMSYIYAAPECKDGTITINKFKPYLWEFLKYTSLNRYDLQIMPYLMYYYCVFCSFMPPYDNLPIDYFKIANHTDKLANWLYNNVENLSSEVVAL